MRGKESHPCGNCWPRLGLKAVISFQEKIMSAICVLQRQLKGNRTQREGNTGWKRVLSSAPLWRRQAEPLMRNSVKPDRGNGKAYKGSVWWSAQKLGCFLWTFSKLPNLGWKPQQLNPSREGDFGKFLFFLEISQDGLVLLLQFGIPGSCMVKPRKAEGSEEAVLTYFECCERLNPG